MFFFKWNSLENIENMAPNNQSKRTFSNRSKLIQSVHHHHHNQHRQWSFLSIIMIIIITITTTSVINPVHASGYFELQFIEGIRNSTTIHVCLKEFWNSQINLNRCTFGQKTLTILYYDYQHYHIESNSAISTSSSSSSATTTTGITNNNNNKQSMIRIPFSFRWIVSQISICT